MSEMRRKEEKMINMRKRKEVIGDKNGETEVACPMMNFPPQAMSNERVWEVIDEFGDAAVRAKKA
jgi:2,4-dienoyl-CoA reductase-like NADH-dependent reductase (Old Yellow Enzyme family)